MELKENNKEYRENRTGYKGELIAQTGQLLCPKECRLDFMTGMQYHAPFIRACANNPNDLDGSIICTFPPHYVFKLHVFKTCAIRRCGNDKELQKAIEAEQERLSYMASRVGAHNYGWEAAVRKKSVRKFVQEDCERTYDQELDEPRLVGKVPGLNVYLELVGCLDRITMDEVDWYGEHGAIATMKRACAYALTCWNSTERRKMASKEDDPQLMIDWKEDYNPEVKAPYMPHNGLGYTNFDPARRFKKMNNSGME